jgi:hypothetical protein
MSLEESLVDISTINPMVRSIGSVYRLLNYRQATRCTSNPPKSSKTQSTLQQISISNHDSTQNHVYFQRQKHYVLSEHEQVSNPGNTRLSQQRRQKESMTLNGMLSESAWQRQPLTTRTVRPLAVRTSPKRAKCRTQREVCLVGTAPFLRL